MNQTAAIAARNLTKRYRDGIAVDNLDFELLSGEVLGLIGPNGAGKSTTMRMLTGFINPTRGRVEVMGVDRKSDPIAAHRRIGYLPENVPLHPDLKVQEYLSFRARLKGLGRRERRERIASVLETLALAHVARRQIAHLSKGYRQRVGLAATLLNAPEILILDEPTIGLDPAQTRQFRALVTQLKEVHSLLVSSHILTEMEKICDRVLILHRGRRVALDEPAQLVEQASKVTTVVVEASVDPEALLRRIERIDGIKHAGREESGAAGWVRFRVQARRDARPLEAIGRAVHEEGGVVRELRSLSLDLEGLYHRLVAIEGDHE